MLFNKNISEEKDGIENELIDNVINKTEEDLIIENNNIKYEITTTNNNNNNNEYKNISIINLGECEKILKKHNNISENESLIILKRDIYKKGVSIPKLEYEVLDMNNKNKLDLNVCKDTKIEILLPHAIEENNEKKYNIESDYCNDTCYTYTTEKGPDITLSDRRNECINNIMSICEDNCEFGGYKSNTKKFICKCEIKTNISLSEVLTNKEQILNKFIKIDDKTNFKIMKCFKILFTKDGKKNFDNYIILPIIIINIICLKFLLTKNLKEYIQ
jgi:hypothetical protein